LYNYGLAPTNYRGLASANTIASPTGAVSNAPSQSYAPESQATTQGAGGIQASNASLQNITNFAGSLGTLSGNYNQQRGLENYNSYNQSKGLGGIGGQTTPWGLRSKEEGGFGGDLNSRDYFVNPSAEGIAYGSRYSLNGDMLGSEDILRNAYTGDTQGYGGNTSYQRLQNNPFGQDFWGAQTPNMRATGGLDYEAVNNQVNQMTKDYLAQMQTMYGGANNEWAQMDPMRLKQQLIQGATPKMGASNGPLSAWYEYASRIGAAAQPFSYYNDRARQVRDSQEQVRSFY